MVGDLGIPLVIRYGDVLAQEMKPGAAALRVRNGAETVTNRGNTFSAEGRWDV